eukprot:3540531-Rhodomonas_salina.1
MECMHGDSFVPSHVKQWVSDMEQAQEAEVSTKAAFPTNAIEAEVIEGGRRRKNCTDEETDTKEDEVAFARHMFENKKAHRVACLLASARLISSFPKSSTSLLGEDDPFLLDSVLSRTAGV